MWGTWGDCRSCKFASRNKFLSVLPPDTHHLHGKLGGKLGGKHGKKSGELGGDYKNPLSKEERRECGKLGGDNKNPLSQDQRRKLGKLGGKFGKRGGKFGKRGKKFGKLGGNQNNKVNAERKSAAARACAECSQCRRSLLREKFRQIDWGGRKSGGITCKECRLGEPKERRANRAMNSPIACRACEDTLPRSEFRPDARGRYRIHEGLICEKCREAGKLDGRGRKRKHIDK